MLHIQPETLRWRSRDVRYYAGGWDDVLSVLRDFETVPFCAGPGEPPNPFLLTVSRKPGRYGEGPIPVGVVSRRYSLVQHRELATRCRDGLVAGGVDAADLSYEVGVTQLGEWMNFRMYFPDKYGLRDAHGHRVALRLECFNAVDGSSRLIVLFGWYRFVCANGMVIGESKIEIRERHGWPLKIDPISDRIASSLRAAQADRCKLEDWGQTRIAVEDVAPWVDGAVTDRWGKTAAARVFHICRSGHDVELVDFTPRAAASKKLVRSGTPVAGSPSPARTRYDVLQALSFVATKKNDADDRLARQADVPALLQELPSAGPAPPRVGNR
ncbi:MAG: DUF932 domain-containing protein [Acidobacteria bacterium]|nr:DUF932 domain-containing protein [Acidobacteriota bacterium]